MTKSTRDKELPLTFSLHFMATGTFAPMLRSLSALLDKGAEQAAARKFDPAVLANARLAPDMFPLTAQVQIASDHAKNCIARLAGLTAPRFEDSEKTLDELKARIAKTVDYVESVPASAFEGADERVITVDLPPIGLVLEVNGAQYLKDWALPHFYFHVVTAFDILRHNGVEIGKRDYLSHVGAFMRPRGER
jgi:hypothetical protein